MADDVYIAEQQTERRLWDGRASLSVGGDDGDDQMLGCGGQSEYSAPTGIMQAGRRHDGSSGMMTDAPGPSIPY